MRQGGEGGMLTGQLKDPEPQGPARTAPFQQSAAAYQIAPNPAV